jgi:hypothetical protein
MNQEQLLDHVAELITGAAKEGPGAIMLLFKDDFTILRLKEELDPDAIVVHIFNSKSVIDGLSPSTWMKIAKEIWACKSSSSSTIKFPAPAGVPGRKPGRKPQTPDDPGKVS